MMWGVAIGAFFLLTFPAVASNDEALRVDLVVTHLDLGLALDYEARSLAGTAILTVANAGEQAAETLPVQLGRLLSIESVTNARGQPVPFEQDIVQFKDWPQFQINQAHLSIAPPLGAGESRRFVVRYSGTLVGYTETGMRYVQDRVDREFTILRADPSQRLA